MAKPEHFYTSCDKNGKLREKCDGTKENELTVIN